MSCTGVGLCVGGVSELLQAFGACSGGGGDEGGTAWGGAWLEHGCALFLYMGVSECEGLCEKLFLCGLVASLRFAFCFALCVCVWVGLWGWVWVGASGVVIGWMMRGVGLLFLFWGCRWVYEKGAVFVPSPLLVLYIYVCLSLCFHAIMWRF